MKKSVVAVLLSVAASGLGLAADADVLWRTKVLPLLDTQCVKCHGVLEQKGGLELDTVENLMKGGDEGAAVIPGKPDESPFYTYLAEGSDPHMPPKKQLSPEDMGIIREWIIALGQAPDPKAEGSAPEAPPEPVPTEPSAVIDFFLGKAWAKSKVAPAPLADDRTFARRVWLELAGRAPSLEELEAFLFSPSPHKRAELVDRLLVGPEFARNMREVWDVLLLNRPQGGRLKRRVENGWFAYLEEVFLKNRPWDEVVREIITARPDTEDRKGALWFLYERKNEHQQIAEAIAPVIYGTRIDCAQCHDHALAREIKQAHYWGLVAAFNRSKNIEGGKPAVEESAIGGFMNFTNLKKESQPAVVTMLTGVTLTEERPAEGTKEEDTPDKYIESEAKPKVPKFSRRAALAEAATRGNPLLARSFVNRTWAQFFGRGIVHPVDEMNSRNTPAHPELLDWLAEDFRSHGYNIRRLVRGIVLSGAWQRAAWTGPGADAPAADMFAAMPEVPLTGETLGRSILTALGRPLENDAFFRELTGRFTDVMPREYLATTQQAMFMTNSPSIAELLKPDEGTTVARLLALPEPSARVRESFLRLLGRLPDAEEETRATVFLKEREAEPAAALQQLLWALLSGPEFSFAR